MKSLKQASLYVGTVVVAIAAIIGVLQLGSSLPAPTSSSVHGAAVVAGSEPSTGDALLQNLQGNLNHPLSHLFIQLLVVVAACRIIGRLFVRFGLLAVVEEMSAGILLGPSLFGWLAPWAFAFVFPTESLGTLRLLSQVGICLFMFTVGMELNVGHVRNKAATAVAVTTRPVGQCVYKRMTTVM
jgi:hypothetical protein